jgi:K+-transporting ATPase ATPase A chain
MAALALLLKALKNSANKKIGNFYVLFLKSATRILLPLAIVVGFILILNSVPMTLHGKETVTTVQGDSVMVSRGPAAAIVSIKQLGTNGGGYFGANSAHPFENPNAITNIIETISIALIPIAMVFTFGYYLNRRKMAWMIFIVMTVGFLMLLAPTVHYEAIGNPLITKLGITQANGSMEGKEVRFGSALSAYWGTITTSTSNGSVNAMHDSFSPLSGAFLMLGMQINALYGGVGVGFISMFLFIIISVFISGLMIGRTPELLGKKIESKEVKIAVIITLLHPFLILGGTALSSYALIMSGGNDAFKWLNNPGSHGFSEMLYEFTSAAANNGSEFSGLAANTAFWNISTGIVMLLGRYLPIIGALAIGGSLAAKKNIPPSAGTLKVDSLMFGVMLFFVIIIIGALLFIPALTLGPLAEFVTCS